MWTNRSLTVAVRLTLSGYVLLCRTYMSSREHLGEFEQIVLLAVLRLGETPTAFRCGTRLRSVLKRSLTVGALYRTLDRLEAKGMSHHGFGGSRCRTRRKVETLLSRGTLGARALRQSQKARAAMWKGVELSKVILARKFPVLIRSVPAAIHARR